MQINLSFTENMIDLLFYLSIYVSYLNLKNKVYFCFCQKI